MYNKEKSFIQQYWLLYLVGFVVILGIKYFYSKAGSKELQWILAPTVWWVTALSGIPFENVPFVGYINHSYRFIIAPSCCGVQFMNITLATLIFSFVHRLGTIKRGLFWTVFSLGISYLLTIFVNGFRITLSIYLPARLPLFLHKPDLYSGWLTPARLHTAIGIAVYFSSLFVIYFIAGAVSLKIAFLLEKPALGIHVSSPENSHRIIHWKWAPPVFWYFSFALGIPFLNKAYQNGPEKFTEYALLMIAVCLTILFLFGVASIIRSNLVKQKKSGRAFF